MLCAQNVMDEHEKPWMLLFFFVFGCSKFDVVDKLARLCKQQHGPTEKTRHNREQDRENKQ